MNAGAESRVLAFDMDGVLFDTEAVKIAAFVDAFTDLDGFDDDARARVHEYNAANRGVPREAKIRHALSGLLNLPESLHEEVSARYAELLEMRLPACPPINGLADFLESVDAVRYVASSAPESEIRRNLRRHDLEGAFERIYGYPWRKTQALQEIAQLHAPAAVLFFGDAPADLDAARAAGVAFAAVNPNSGLREHVQEYFDDFTGVDQSAVDRLRAAVGGA